MSTLLDDKRIESLSQQLESVRSVPGDVIELGVYKGGSLKRLAETLSLFANDSSLPKKRLWGFDTFTGIPVQDKTIDHHTVGDFSDTSLEGVRSLLKDYPVELVQGFFPHSHATQEALDQIAAVSFAHFDGDQYDSCVSFLAFCQKRLTPGGIIVFDDYDWAHCKGVTRAIHKFLGENADEYVVMSRISMQISVKRLG